MIFLPFCFVLVIFCANILTKRSEKMNPEIFGWQHLVYLAVCLIISIASLVCIKIFVKDEKKQDIIVRCIGGLLLAMIVWNRIAIAISNKNGWNLIPDSFCGMSSLVLALSRLYWTEPFFLLSKHHFRTSSPHDWTCPLHSSIYDWLV